MMSFSKGDKVKLNVDTCFTLEQGGKRRFPLVNYMYDEMGVVIARRAPTREELQAWEDSDESKGMDSAGETKLAPRSVGVLLHRDQTFTVVRGRARMTCVWGNPVPGYCLVTAPDGSHVFVKRDLLTHA